MTDFNDCHIDIVDFKNGADVMKSKVLFCAGALFLTAMQSTSAMAAITLTTGAGSAVTTAQASANFNPTNSLNDNPYIEDGLEFSRTDLSFNNNGCGYAGCAGHVGFTGFSGNYMYGVGSGYFDIKSTGAAKFAGLEFAIGTGFFSPNQNVTWQAFLNNILVGSGSSALSAGTIVGFSGAGGFDTLRYTDAGSFGASGAPAFDSVRAQFFDGGAVPEPATWLMMILGFGMIGAAVRRRPAQVNVNYSFA